MLAFDSRAQISGTVTVNSASATVAGINYQTFTALAAALNSVGVNGPLVVNVVSGSGPYNEQVNFNQITGMSSTNTITINGNGCTISYNATVSTAPHTFMFSGADYFTVNNLNMVGLGATYALVCHLWSNSDNNTFNGCTFTAPLGGTSTTQVPFSLSGSGTSATSVGSCGSNNTVNSSTVSGGYYNTVFYGNSVAPFNINNKITNSYMVDYYVYGCYNVYCQGTTVKGNVVERMNRTNTSTCYGIYFSTGSIANGLIEGNHIRRLYNSIPNSTNATYCIYLIASASSGSENVVRNNIISDINTSGAIYGIYFSGASFANAYHNTLSFDDQTSTAGLVYALYLTGSSCNARNNIVYISRTGTGAKYNIYLTGSNVNCNNNVLVNTATGGVPAIGYASLAYATLAAWQATGNDLNSISSDPMFTSPSTLNYAPTSTVVNNQAFPLGVLTDFNNTSRSVVTPDPGAIEVFTTACTAPAANSVPSPTFVYCPGATVNIGVANTYTTAGYTYQWQSSNVSGVGPFTSIPGATLANYVTTPLTQNTYYTAVITCTNTLQNTTTSSGTLLVAGVTTSNVPYYESFESLAPNKLPNCSWTASNLGGTSLTQTVSNNGGRIPRTGNNFATFYYSPANTNYFYTNGINLKAGVTYSASVWYIGDLAQSTNWTDLSIMIGTQQLPNGLVTIASTNGPAVSPSHKSLSNTFTVATTGIYYVAVRGTASAGAAQYLSWDDLAIEIPCSLNEPNLAIAANYTNVCSGAPFNMVASGANSYTWSTGSTAQGVTVVPQPTTTSYYVVGSSTLSGCTKTLTQPVSVNLSPQVIVFPQNPSVCAGKSITLTAAGAGLYNWNTGALSPSIIVSPSATTSYSVIGLNAIGCSSMTSVQVTVNPLPSVLVSGNTTVMCVGETVTLSALGAQSYQWYSNSSNMQTGNPIIVSPTSSKNYTVYGTDSKGCAGAAAMVLEVNECTGVSEIAEQAGVHIYPNPSTGVFNIEFATSDKKTVQVMDITGRIIQQNENVTTAVGVNIAGQANGVYFVKINAAGHVSMVKVVKQD